MRAARPLILVVVTASLTTALAACGDDGSAEPTVTLSGVAYGFNTPDPVAGAVVRVVEAPDVEATTAAAGTWSLEVPANAEATPYVSHPDFVTMHAQTFAVGDAPIADIYFQMVTPRVYDLLAGVIGITPDPTRCQVASTVSEKAVQGITFAEFTAHGAHGVAGATVALTPDDADVVYFNVFVVPEPSLTETSRDGGVVWGNMPVGRHTIHATHATKTFADVTIDCQPGRLINPSPPKGLAEL